MSLACLALAGCATVPVVSESHRAHPKAQVQISGSRGPLSARQSKAVLSRLAAQAPNAGALERHLAIEQAVAESPLFTGNRVTILRDGTETFPAMFAAIQGAQRSIELEYYIFEDVSCNGQSLSDLLVAKRKAGVAINVIYDGIGSVSTPDDFLTRLKDAGVQLVQFNPPNPLKWRRHFSLNDRDHRKMLIADGTLAIVGGVNLSSTYQSAPGSAGSDETTPHEFWRDTDLQIAGPVVTELQKLFLQHWQQQSGPPLGNPATAPPGPQGDEVVRIIGSAPSKLTARYYATVLSAIQNAESAVWMTAGYFVPTHQEKEDLIRAARRGVDVQLLLPSHSDSSPALAVQRSHYSDLLEAGVKVYERDASILHSKTLTVDGAWSVVGSSNFDARSVLFNDEVDAVVVGRETAAQLQRIFQEDLEHAHPIDLARWKRRPVAAKLREHFWRVWEKLL